MGLHGAKLAAIIHICNIVHKWHERQVDDDDNPTPTKTLRRVSTVRVPTTLWSLTSSFYSSLYIPKVVAAVSTTRESL
jgi:hypothetical protein